MNEENNSDSQNKNETDSEKTVSKGTEQTKKEVSKKPKETKKKQSSAQKAKRLVRGITQKERTLIQNSALDEIDTIVQKSSVSSKKKKSLKLKRKIGYILGGIFVIFCLYYLASRPAKGSLMYGACKVFLELQLEYPPTLRVSKVEEFWESVRIWHAYIDGFGEYRLEPIECFFKTDEKTGMFTFQKVTIKRREIDQKTVEKFNTIIPTLIVQPPDLNLPQPLPDSLKDLQIDISRYLKPIL